MVVNGSNKHVVLIPGKLKGCAVSVTHLQERMSLKKSKGFFNLHSQNVNRSSPMWQKDVTLRGHGSSAEILVH